MIAVLFVIALTVTYIVWLVVSINDVRPRGLVDHYGPAILEADMMDCEIWHVNKGPSSRARFVVFMTNRELVLARRNSHIPFGPPIVVEVPISAIHWYGAFSQSELLIYVALEGDWIRIRLRSLAMVKILDQIASKAPRSTGPSLRDYGPVTMWQATQNERGGWVEGERQSLFLLPNALLLIQNGNVKSVIRMIHVHRVGLIHRNPPLKTILQVYASGKTYSFAGPMSETLAEKLAQAAGCVLEKSAPKKKRAE
jgi:hypothetical protein